MSTVNMETLAEQLADFRSQTSLSPLVVDNSAQMLFIMSFFPDHLVSVYRDHYEGNPGSVLQPEKFNAYTETNSENSIERWSHVYECLRGSDLETAELGTFLDSHPCIAALMDQIVGERVDEKLRWTPLKTAIAYLTVYQPNYEELWTVFDRLSPRTGKAIRTFLSNSKYKQIDLAELSALMKYVIDKSSCCDADREAS